MARPSRRTTGNKPFASSRTHQHKGERRIRSPFSFTDGFSIRDRSAMFSSMSTVQEIEAALPRLSRIEIEQIRAWIDDYLEDQLELTDEVKAKLDQSRREIADGQYTARQPK